MKRRIAVISAFTIAVSLLILIGIFILPEPSAIISDRNKLSIIADATQVYQDAVSRISSTEPIGLSVSWTKQTITKQNVFTERRSITQSVDGYGTDAMCAATSETLSIGQQDTHITEIFSNDVAYIRIGDSTFSSDITASEYSRRIIPQIIINADLYRSVTGFDSESLRLIHFAQPTDSEPWATEEGAEFLGAKAAACITKDGNLLRCTYSATYQKDDVFIHITVLAEQADAAPIQLPRNTNDYVKISYLDGPRQLERASGLLLQSGNIQSTYNERIYCQAFGDERTKNATLQITSASQWSAQVDTQVVSVNSGHVGDTSRHTHNERFADGKYTLSIDNGAPEDNSSIDEDAMKKYCKNILVSTIMMPRYITGAELMHDDGNARITFSANDAFVQQIRTNCCQTLYEKPELLDELAEDHSIDAMECYLDLDLNTGIPTAAGILYNGAYTIDELPYHLQFQADQTFA